MNPKMPQMRIPTAWLLRLYPQAWCARYGKEFAALLDDCPITLMTPLTLLDVLRGAADARLHAQRSLWSITAMSNPLRRTEITVFCAWIAVVVAGLSFQKMTEYDDFMDAARAYPLIGIAYDAVIVGAVVALLAVLAGGVPLAAASLRYALAARRRDILLLFAVPVLALLALVAYAVVAIHIPDGATSAAQLMPDGTVQRQWLVSISGASNTATDTIQGPTTTAKLLFLGLGAVLALGAAASAWAVSAAISRSEVDERWYRFARIPTIIAALAIAVIALADIVWGLALHANAPSLFDGNDGLVATSTALSWLANAAVMTLAALVALVALVRRQPPTAQAAPAAPATTPAQA